MTDFGTDIEGESQPRDGAIAAIAARQHGVVARRQLTALGLGKGAIDYRIAAGRLHPLHRGVYAVGHSRVIGNGRWMAAVLACGDGALLSHRSAAALWGLLPGGGARAEVTVVASGRRGPPGMTVHQVRRLHPEDHAVVEGIPITSVARTLLDLAEVVSLRRVENAFEAAERLRLFDLVALTRLTDRSAGRHGLKPVRHVMSSWGGWVEDTRSPLEGQFAEFCRDTGLPMPAFNTVVEGYVVDALWADARLVVELDSYGFHRSRSAFESDRERDAALQLAGYRVIRVTSRRLSREPEAVERTIRSLLGRQPLRHSPLS